ncbi:hypothetical protein [Polyangium sp. 15x6]|uniref:hypothetical protein n=1 Tax=Polyangium sp. 15x6 TaxID=3042687 RepID=UPI00249BFBD4|nr:hypothetical protein [Polyangium sp. 15x6]MDI3288146.1 hypothetical protein [Polyangium sp. 15x6]
MGPKSYTGAHPWDQGFTAGGWELLRFTPRPYNFVVFTNIGEGVVIEARSEAQLLVSTGEPVHEHEGPRIGIP